MELTQEQLAKTIDHTILRPEATEEDIIEFCREAKRFNFATVCLNPVYVNLAIELLEDSEIKVGTVVGFPLGASASEVKAFEAHDAVLRGAGEIDMVMNVGALKGGKLEFVRNDIMGVVNAARKNNVVVKVILETCFLSDEEKQVACRVSEEAGADFVKTSTGLAKAGARVEDVALMRSCVSEHIGVKASGGIRTVDDALKMLEAGASRIGTSVGVKIMEEYASKQMSDDR
jgi:deoxyribose-phosphate aldolase